MTIVDKPLENGQARSLPCSELQNESDGNAIGYIIGNESVSFYNGGKPSKYSYRSHRKSILQNHLKNHMGVKCPECPDCLYESAKKARFNVRLKIGKIDTGETTFKCLDCNQISFTR